MFFVFIRRDIYQSENSRASDMYHHSIVNQSRSEYKKSRKIITDDDDDNDNELLDTNSSNPHKKLKKNSVISDDEDILNFDPVGVAMIVDVSDGRGSAAAGLLDLHASDGVEDIDPVGAPMTVDESAAAGLLDLHTSDVVIDPVGVATTVNVSDSRSSAAAGLLDLHAISNVP